MSEVYDLFVERVSTGRGLTQKQVKAVAEGRIWSGAQGKERGLVDAFGGLPQALQMARTLAGLSADAPVRVEGPEDGILGALGLDSHANEEQVAQAFERQRMKLWSPLALAPRDLTPWLTGLAPLLGSEHVLALWPVAVTVR
jgi:protease-4